MGCTASTPLHEDENDPFIQQQRANDAIERSLLQEKQKEKGEIKLLLLGAGESGKSTVLKQLKLLHHGGFSHQERLQYAQVIWADAVQSMKILIIQARRLGIALDCEDPVNHTQLFECKRLLLSAQALSYVNPSVAGGSGFLNDYVLKYSERYEAKRRIHSTGQVKGLDFSQEDEEEAQEEEEDGYSSQPLMGMDFKELSRDLNDTGDTHMFVQKKPAASAEKKVSRDDLAHAVQQLWLHDPGIRQCFSRSNEFQLEGSAAYYFDNIERFADPSYVCSDEDILKGRIKTTGITETNFKIGSSNFKVLDAGGQRSERKKWIHSFQGITAVIFVLALSEYDQVLFEDERVNRMRESIMLFGALLNSKWFKDTPFILFLNKTDLFEEKVKRMPIRKYFPDYQGRVGDAEAGIKYFENIFLSMNKSGKPLYVKRTCATDRESMKFVLTAVTDMIVQQNLKKSGIL